MNISKKIRDNHTMLASTDVMLKEERIQPSYMSLGMTSNSRGYRPLLHANYREGIQNLQTSEQSLDRERNRKQSLDMLAEILKDFA